MLKNVIIYLVDVTVNANVSTVLNSIPASSDTLDPRGGSHRIRILISRAGWNQYEIWQQCYGSGSVRSVCLWASRMYCRSISTRYGSGSGSGSGLFYHQAKIVRKTLILSVLWLLYAFYLWKMCKCSFKKRSRTKIVGSWSGSVSQRCGLGAGSVPQNVTDWQGPDPDPLVRGADPDPDPDPYPKT